MKTDFRKRPLRLDKFIARVYDIYFPRAHGHYGTDADHVPVIPGNNFALDSNLTSSPDISAGIEFTKNA
jgi:hypothetical protein